MAIGTWKAAPTGGPGSRVDRHPAAVILLIAIGINAMADEVIGPT